MATVDVWHYAGTDDDLRIVYDDQFDSAAIHLSSLYNGICINATSSLQISDIVGMMRVIEDGEGVHEFGNGTRSWTVSPSDYGMVVASISSDGSMVKMDVPKEQVEVLADALERRWGTLR